MRDQGIGKLPSWRKSNLVIRDMRRESSLQNIAKLPANTQPRWRSFCKQYAHYVNL
jgi:hypothetical protein